MIDDVTGLLRQASSGDGAAADRLYAALYPELKRLARAHLSRAGTLSLDAPALVHDAYLRFKARGGAMFAERRVFFAYASKVMRSVVIDYVRERGAEKRGSGERHVTLTTGLAGEILDASGIERLHEAMTALERVSERAHRVVEMRYFGGMTEDEVGDALGVSVPTVKRDWRTARAFLHEYLRDLR